MNIEWNNPAALFGLWLLLPLAWLLARAHARRRRAAERFADPVMAPRLMPLAGGARPWVREGLLLLGLAALLLGLARPRWGVYFSTVKREGADIMVLLDVSRSMLSDDVRPSRLARAKSDVKDLLKRVTGDRVGLVAFAGKAVVACPLTTDHGFFLSVLDDVGPDTAPRGGTAIGDAIRKALQTMEQEPERDQALLLITDGEDHDSFPKQAAALAGERGVRIFAVGMGDPVEGARVPVLDAAGNRVYLKYEGQEVWSKMDEALLRSISLDTGGAYVPARTRVYDLGEVYETHLAGLRAGGFEEEKRKRRHERFQVFLALGLGLILVHLLLRPYARGAFALLLLALPVHADERLAFNDGVRLQAAGESDAARAKYLEAAGAADSALAARARYNLGTLAAAAASFGEDPANATPAQRKKGVEALEKAVGHFRACLELEPGHADARFNLELIRRWLARMRKLWEEKDKEQQKKKEPDLLQFLEQLMRRVEKGEPNLVPEVDALDAKIDEQVPEQARAQLKTWSEEARVALTADRHDDAYVSLDRIWSALAPFPRVVKEAVKVQERTIREQELKGQLRVARLAVVMQLKAQAGREAASQAPPPPPGQPPPADHLEEAEEKAIENAPRIREETMSAAEQLAAQESDAALPHEKEALRLLKEIEDLLPKDEQQQQQQQQEDQEQEQNEEQQDQQQQQQPQSQDQPQDRQPEEKLSPEQIESLLRKAQEREREHKEKKKELKKAIAVGGKVKRDW